MTRQQEPTLLLALHPSTFKSYPPTLPSVRQHMIHAVLICESVDAIATTGVPYRLRLVNTSGVSRLTKFYTPLHQSTQTVVQKIFSLVSTRPPGLCNFLDAPELEEFLGFKGDADERWRVVYRSYATLFFVFVVDGAESELGILDLIQVHNAIHLRQPTRSHVSVIFAGARRISRSRVRKRL